MPVGDPSLPADDPGLPADDRLRLPTGDLLDLPTDSDDPCLLADDPRLRGDH
jgi:hypothetical protein